MLLKKITPLLLAPLILLGTEANAITLETTTAIIPSEQNKTVQAMINSDENAAHLIAVKVTPVDSPYTLNPTASHGSKEILFTPARKLLPAGKSANIAFYYQGPKDNKERYYSIQWEDSVMTSSKSASEKSGTVMAKAIVSTVLVVHPRKKEMQYQYDKLHHTLKNSGNTSFKATAYGLCKKKDPNNPKKRCQESIYLSPGKTTGFSHVNMSDARSSLGYWNDNRFIYVVSN